MQLSHLQNISLGETQILENTSFPIISLVEPENLRLVSVLLDVYMVDDNDPFTGLEWPA